MGLEWADNEDNSEDAHDADDVHVCRDYAIVQFTDRLLYLTEHMVDNNLRVPDELMQLSREMMMLCEVLDVVGNHRKTCCSRFSPKQVHEMRAEGRTN